MIESNQGHDFVTCSGSACRTAMSGNRYKNAHSEHYLRDIREDIDWYGDAYSIIRNRYDIDNESPETAADGLIKKFGL